MEKKTHTNNPFLPPSPSTQFPVAYFVDYNYKTFVSIKKKRKEKKTLTNRPKRPGASFGSVFIISTFRSTSST